MSEALSIKEATEAITKIADAMEELAGWGIEPDLHFPPELIAAAERIAVVTRTPRSTAWVRDASVTQLVLGLTQPGEDVTAPTLHDRISRHGRDVNTRAISVALHRAAEGGHFERRERGVYRLSAPPISLDTEQPEEAPPASRTEGGRGDEMARHSRGVAAVS